MSGVIPVPNHLQDVDYLRRALANGTVRGDQAERYRGYVEQLEAEHSALVADIFPGVVMATTGDKRLLERRISPATFEAFQIVPNESGWTYPTPDGQGTRWKAYEKGMEAKYKWLYEKPETAKYYYPPGFFEAVQRAGGVCWLVSGEADTWAMHSAGIAYVFSTYGETNIPDTLSQDLQAFGIVTLYIAPDLDPEGKRWAQKVADALAGSGIELDCRTLPSDLGAHGDIGKAWQGYTEQRSFERWLLGLPRVHLTPTPSIPKIPQTLENCKAVPPGYRALVEGALNVKGYKDNGYTAIRCPFHQDSKPSGSLHQEVGLHCFACDRWYTWQDIGIKLGLGMIRAWLNTQAARCLSTQTREKLLQTQQGTVGRVLDGLYLSGWEGGRMFTVSDAIEILFSSCQMREKSLRNVLNTYSQYFPTIQVKKENLPENFGNKSPWRPVKIYRLMSPSEIGELIGVFPGQGQHYDPLDVDALRSNRAYRIAVHGAMLQRLPGKYSRKQLGKRLGVTGRTTQTYDAPSQVEALPQVEVTALETDELETLPDDRLGGVWLETDLTDPHTGEKIRFALTKKGYRKALTAGAVRFYRVKQTMNFYQAKVSHD